MKKDNIDTASADHASNRLANSWAGTRGRLSRQWFPAIAGIAAFAALWQALAMIGIIDTRILPPPARLVATAQELVETGELWGHTASSITRVLVGFVVGSSIGTFLGLLLGSSRRLASYLIPIIELLRPIPPIAWIPLAILWFGIGDHPSYFIVAIGAFFPVFVNAFRGIRSVHPSHVLAAKSLGANRRLLLTDVFLPAALPFISTGLRVGIGTAWTSVIAAEMVGAQSGLGYMIQLNRILLQTDKIVIGMVTIGLAGLIMNQGLVALERHHLAWLQEDSNE